VIYFSITPSIFWLIGNLLVAHSTLPFSLHLTLYSFPHKSSPSTHPPHSHPLSTPAQTPPPKLRSLPRPSVLPKRFSNLNPLLLQALPTPITRTRHQLNDLFKVSAGQQRADLLCVAGGLFEEGGVARAGGADVVVRAHFL
jgi:hypothetical protein